MAFPPSKAMRGKCTPPHHLHINHCCAVVTGTLKCKAQLGWQDAKAGRTGGVTLLTGKAMQG